MTSVLGKGIYELPEAARLIGGNADLLRRWFRPAGAPGRGFELDYPKLGARYAMSFLDLVEAKYVAQLRARGVPFKEILKLHDELARSFESKHPFAHEFARQIAVDPKGRPYIDTLDGQGRRFVAEPLNGWQQSLPEIVEPFLRALEYDQATHLASRWRVHDGVIIDPARRFGRPIVDEAFVPTIALYDAYMANGEDVDVVARWWEIGAAQVQAAVDFERRMAA